MLHVITLNDTLTLSRTPLDVPSQRPLHLITHITHKRQTSMPSAGFEPSIPASERPQTYALDPAATEIMPLFTYLRQFTSSYIATILAECHGTMFTVNTKKGQIGASSYLHYTAHLPTLHPSYDWRGRNEGPKHTCVKFDNVADLHFGSVSFGCLQRYGIFFMI